MDEPSSFGAWLKRRRKALDLTQTELAEQIGCSLSTIVKIEADERRPSRQVAELLSSALEIPAEQRGVFVKMARGERRLERLPTLQSTPGLTLEPVGNAVPSGIPVPSNPLVGREHERQEILRLLLDPACRLLTLTGPGGIGKTRLAKEVGLELVRFAELPFPDGVYWVPLASVHSANYLALAIAQVLGVVVSGNVDVRAQMLSMLRERKALLLLDNLEHLLEGVDLLAELLQEAPGVKVLATSQVRLNLSGEWVFDIQGLPFPAVEEGQALDQYGAIRLFLNYARQMNAAYEPNCEEYQTIGQICRLLEGMPLAIQLAAGWARVLAPTEILAELERSTQVGEFPEFLADSTRDVPERHRSLVAAFDYSWRLLDEHERQVLRRLSVFEGGFQREAAERVADLSLSELAGLMDKSLISRVDQGRYSLHDLVHKYGFVRLKENPEEMLATLDRHCRYYGDLLQPFVFRLKGRTQAELQAMIAAEIDNLRQAWDWAIKNKRTREIQLLSQGFTWFYELRGWYQEGLAVFKQAVATLSSLESTAESMDRADKLSLAAVLVGYGWFLNRHGRNTPAKEYFLRGLSLLRGGESPESLANVLRFIGMLDLQVGEYAEGRSYLEESLRISRPVGYIYGVALCYSHLGVIDYLEGMLLQARKDFDSALELWEELEEPIGTSYCLRYLRQVICKLDMESLEYSEAVDRVTETLALSRASDDAWGTGTTLNHLGVLAQLEKNHGEAAAYFQEAAGFFRQIGDPYGLAQSSSYLGKSLTCLGADDEARKAYIEAFASAREADSLPFMLDAMVSLAQLSQPELDAELIWRVIDLVKEQPAAMFETREAVDALRLLLPSREASQPGSRADADIAHLSLEEIFQRLAQPGGSR